MFCRTINHGISPRVSVSKLYKRIIAVGIMLANQIRSVWMFSAKLVTVSCKPALIIQTYYTVGVLDKSYGTIMIWGNYGRILIKTIIIIIIIA